MDKKKIELMVKEIKTSLEQAQHILNSASPEELTYQEYHSAAMSAQTAASRLMMISGALY